MMRVLFRADGSTRIGTGHVMRCMALAAELRRRGCKCAFAMRPLPGHLIDEVKAAGYEVFSLAGEQEQGGAQDAFDTRAALRGRDGWHWLVTDHYGLDARWHGAMRLLARRILAIDDLADRPHDCDVLLDQNLQLPGRYEGLGPSGSVLLLGPAYALLREEFQEVKRGAQEPQRVLVSFGGADEDGVALDAVAALERTGARTVQVIAGARNPHLERLRNECTRLGYEFLASTQEMARCMARASLAIGAGGTTMLERFAARLPALVVPIADNQRPGSLAAREAGAIELVDVPPGDRVTALAAATGALLADPRRLERMAEAGACLCDGRGARRVAQVLQRQALVFRSAVAADCQQLHAWRNAPQTRRHATDTAEIALADHRRWFAKVLADSARAIWVAELDGEPVGVVRFDTAPQPQGLAAVISVYLVPSENPGRGWGRAVIAGGAEQACARWPGLARVDARISPDNQASLRAFAACGFEPGTEPGVYHLTQRSSSA